MPTSVPTFESNPPRQASTFQRVVGAAALLAFPSAALFVAAISISLFRAV